MPINYQQLTDTATRIISENGGDVTFTYTEAGTTVYDPVSGQMATTGGSTETVTLKAVLTRYNRQEGFLSDSTVLKDAAKVMLVGVVNREVGDNITVDGVEYKIVYKDTVRPNVSDVILTTLVVSL
jgi:hypothetical protein